ncbi:hypothetical protein FCM35_KLT02909 [Carex littledalei]|uniref:Uncharacterized protein n=1 Tax=Carex littledalei TaxID=544730 RepID=A0A833R0Z7_9POAL|nr:hypothetical protein FCM35_KLT02909 [Carex littledalei]
MTVNEYGCFPCLELFVVGREELKRQLDYTTLQGLLTQPHIFQVSLVVYLLSCLAKLREHPNCRSIVCTSSDIIRVCDINYVYQDINVG